MTFVTDPLHRRAAQILQDGQWHALHLVIAELVPLVPPGPAIRRYEALHRASTARRRHDADPTRQGRLGYQKRSSRDQQVVAGARYIAREVLNARAYERRGRGETAEIRMVQLPRATRVDPLLKRSWRLEAENEQLRTRVTDLERRIGELMSGSA